MEAKHFMDLKDQMKKKLNSNFFQGKVKAVNKENHTADILPIESNDEKAVVTCVFPLIMPLNSNFILVPGLNALVWCEKKNGDDNSAHIVSCTDYESCHLNLSDMSKVIEIYDESIETFNGKYTSKSETINSAYYHKSNEAEFHISEKLENIDKVESQIGDSKQTINNAEIEIKEDFDFKSKNFVIDKDNDRITMVGGDDKAVLGNELKTFLESLIDTVKQIQVITATGPAPADPSFINQMQSLKSQIDTILSDKVKLS